MHSLEKENEDLRAQNRQLEVVPRAVPTVTADDSALQNIELQDKIQTLEADNSGLRDTIRSLDERTTNLSKEVNRYIATAFLFLVDTNSGSNGGKRGNRSPPLPLPRLRGARLLPSSNLENHSNMMFLVFFF